MRKILLLLISLSLLFSNQKCSKIRTVKKFKDHYYAVSVKKMTFEEAKKFAEANRGYLAIPNDEEENNFLKTLIPKSKLAWIGIHNPEYLDNYCYEGIDGCRYDDYRFRDIKGNALIYTNWAENQPDNLVKKYDLASPNSQKREFSVIDKESKERVKMVEKEYDKLEFIGGRTTYINGEKNKMYQYTGTFNIDDVNKIEKFVLIKVYNDDWTKIVINGHKVVSVPSDTVIWEGNWGWFYYNINVKPYLINGVNRIDVYNAIGKNGRGAGYFEVVAESNNIKCLSGYCLSGYCKIQKIGTQEVKVPIPEIYYDGEPLVEPLGEHWVAMAHNGQWGDFGNHADEYNNPVKFFALIEFDSMPECYIPKGDNKDEEITLGKDKVECNTNLTDFNVTGSIKDGKTYVCQKDKKDKYYCPIELTPCDEVEERVDSNLSVKIKKEAEYDKIELSLNLGSLFNISSGEKKIINKAITFYVNNINKLKKFILKKIKSNKNIKVTLNNNELTKTNSYEEMYDLDVRSYLKNENNVIRVTSLEEVESLSSSILFEALVEPNNVKCRYSSFVSIFKKCTIRKTGSQTVPVEYYEYKCPEINYYGNRYRSIIKSGKSPTPPPKNCKAISYSCKYNPDRKCAYVNNKWQCSLYPCVGEGGDIVFVDDDTPEGINDANNDGWDEKGNCNGTLLIFNGKDMRCRSWDRFGGALGGGCCNEDLVFIFDTVSCSEREKILKRKRDNGMCHLVDQYCAKYWKIFGKKICYLKKKTYCCFESKLARIINEQGREQLKKGWGGAKNPKCRGFTPDEFQKLDFSKMDLSEFFNDLTKDISSNIINNTTNYIGNSINKQLNMQKQGNEKIDKPYDINSPFY